METKGDTEPQRLWLERACPAMSVVFVVGIEKF